MDQDGGATPYDWMEFDDPIVILFNPWSAEDDVSMTSNAERQEYVLRERGRIWRGNHPTIGPKGWSYDQFDKNGVRAPPKRSPWLRETPERPSGSLRIQ